MAPKLRAIFLTHAHNDHIGLLPELIQHGFEGKIYYTRATAALTTIMLQDAMSLKNMDAITETLGKINKQYYKIEDYDDFKFAQKIIPVSTDFRALALRSSHILGLFNGFLSPQRKIEKNGKRYIFQEVLELFSKKFIPI